MMATRRPEAAGAAAPAAAPSAAGAGAATAVRTPPAATAAAPTVTPAPPAVPVAPEASVGMPPVGAATRAMSLAIADLAPAPPQLDPFAAPVTRSIAVMGALPAAFADMGPRMHHHTGASLRSATARAVGARQAVRASDKPCLLPPSPYLLSPHSAPLTCSAARAREAMEAALTEGGVDFEYNAAKWKAKCYLYWASGACHFVVRLYTTPAAAGGGDEGYLVELQRRAGCVNVFRAVYDRVLGSLARAGVLVPGTPAAKRAAALLDAPAPRAGPAPVLPPRPVAATYPPAGCTSCEDEDEEAADGCRPTPADDVHAIVEAFSSLTGMLSSEFDDIATPAAQSVASLTVSRRVRAALGAKALNVLLTATAAGAGAPAAAAAAAATTSTSTPPPPPPPGAAAADRQTSSGSVSSAVASGVIAEVDRADGGAALALIHILLSRAVHPASSVECRTACAIAVSNLAKDGSCVEVLSRFMAPAVLLDCIAQLMVSAHTAALRREAAHAVLRVVTASPATMAAALASDCHLRAGRLLELPGLLGHDALLDRYLRDASAALYTAARS